MLIVCSLEHVWYFLKISSKSVHNFLSYRSNNEKNIKITKHDLCLNDRLNTKITKDKCQIQF